MQSNVGRVISMTAAAASIMLGACTNDSPSGPIVTAWAPNDVMVTVGSPPDNVLSAKVSFTVSEGDSVRVSYQAVGGQVELTPFQPAMAGSVTVALLGLRPGVTYQYHVEDRRGSSIGASPTATFTTAELPSALANIQLQTLSGTMSRFAATGIQLTPTSGYAVIFDSTGAIAWYHDFTKVGLPVSNVVRQPNGNFTAFLGATSGWQPEPGYYVEVTPDGREIHTYAGPEDAFTDNHELILTGSGAQLKANFFTFTDQMEDMSVVGASPSILTAGHQLVRENSAGGIEFAWDAWTHIDLDEWVTDEAAKQTRTDATDFDHPNSIAFDANGNYVVSWRNLNQVMAIDANSGDVLWRIGGLKGDYTFVGDPLNGFSKQHAAKILPNGNLLLFDNGSDHVPAQSRAVEYRLDHAAKTATMVWEYRHDPPLYAPVVGWVERLANGNTWVAFAYFSRIVEVSSSGKVAWEGQLVVNGTTPTVYRIVPVASLY